jgi:hypothetical protein
MIIEYAKMVEYLRALGNGDIEPSCAIVGICQNLQCRFNPACSYLDYDYYVIVADALIALGYDCLHPISKLGFDDKGSKWAFSTPNGNRRRKLCLELADYFENKG